MNEAGNRDRTWRTAQKEAFGKRLDWARREAGYRYSSDFIQILKARRGAVRARTYYSHKAGKRVPDDDETIDLYAEMLDVSRDFLLFGAGAEALGYFLTDDGEPINQPVELFAINPFQPAGIRYIPVLTASDIKRLLNGQVNLITFSGERVPIPQDAAAMANAFAYRIPPHDTSMTGRDGPSFTPGTWLIIDPERDVLPGDFLLAWPANMPGPVLRRLQSSHAYIADAPHFPFKLIALSPHADPITVAEPGDCVILGRLISFTQIC